MGFRETHLTWFTEILFRKEQTMQRVNPLGRNRKAVAARARESAGFIEIAIVSLAGLTMAVVLIAQNIGPDALQLTLLQ
jgi:hypothetical protein